MAVLFLLYAYQTGEAPTPGGFAVVAALLAGSAVLLRLLPVRVLSNWGFQAALFVGDVTAATFVLGWTSSHADLFLIYLLGVLGSVLTRSPRQSLVVAAVTIGLYLVSGWRPSTGWPRDSEFWLRALFLTASSAIMTILSRDSRSVEDEQRRRYEDRLVQVGRLATLGRVAGEVAHRIKGPLTTIAVNAEVLAHGRGCGPEALKELAEIREEVEKCKTILKDLLDLGRIEEMDEAPLDLRSPVKAAIKSIRSQVQRRRVRLGEQGLMKRLGARGDAVLLQEAVFALLQNAVEAVGNGGHVRVRVFTDGEMHGVEVSDDGMGISSDDLERIFEPFFTTKKDQGSGLGLSAALRIAAKHGGTVKADSEGVGRGSVFTLTIPAA